MVWSPGFGVVEQSRFHVDSQIADASLRPSQGARQSAAAATEINQRHFLLESSVSQHCELDISKPFIVAANCCRHRLIDRISGEHACDEASVSAHKMIVGFGVRPASFWDKPFENMTRALKFALNWTRFVQHRCPCDCPARGRPQVDCAPADISPSEELYLRSIRSLPRPRKPPEGDSLGRALIVGTAFPILDVRTEKHRLIGETQASAVSGC